jgi:hypothetical protein
MSTMNNEDEESAAFTDGVSALRQALTAENMGYATDRCAEEYARALDAAQRTADAAGMGGSDRRAWVAWANVQTRGRVLEEATRRRTPERSHTVPRRTVVAWLSAPLTAARIAEATNYNTTVRHGITLFCHVGRAKRKVLMREPSVARPVWTAWACGGDSRWSQGWSRQAQT